MPSLYQIIARKNGKVVTLYFIDLDVAFETKTALRRDGFEIVNRHFDGYAIFGTADDAMHTAQIACQ